MSFVYEALRDKPVAMFMMDDTSPFQDYSGYGRSGTALGGTPPKHISLVNGAVWSTILDTSITARFASPVFKTGKESQSFSLETWMRPVRKGSGFTKELVNLMPDPSLTSSQFVHGARMSTTVDTSWSVYGDTSLRLSVTDNTATQYLYPHQYNMGPQTNRIAPVESGDYISQKITVKALQDVRVRWTYSTYTEANAGAGAQSPKAEVVDIQAGEVVTLDIVDSLVPTPPENVVASILPLLYIYEYGVTSVNTQLGDILLVDGITVINSGKQPLGLSSTPSIIGDHGDSIWEGVPNESYSRLLISDAEQQVLGNNGQMDGITVDGTVVSFVTKYDTAPEARASYDLQQPRAVHAVGVHSADKNSLYINGELVSEVTLTEEQQADQFAYSNAYLYSGDTAGSQKVALNAVGIYGHALDQVAISRHFLYGRNLPDGEEVPDSNGGDHIPVSLSNSNLFLDQWWSTKAEWEEGELRDCAIMNDRLVPQVDEGVSIAGEWLDSVVLETADAEPIYGVVFNWDGVGAKVEVSIDDVNWEEVERGTKVSVIPESYVPGDDVLVVRVSFPGGIPNDTSYMDNLNAVGLLTATTPEASGRTVTLVDATQEREYAPLELHDNWGVEIQSGGSMTISADITENPEPVRTLELWIKALDNIRPIFNIDGVTYVNGEEGSDLPFGEWVLMHIVASSDVTGAISVIGPAQVGQVSIYDTALSAADIAGLYSEYVGNDKFTINDSSSIQITEAAVPVKMYAHDWSIHASG